MADYIRKIGDAWTSTKTFLADCYLVPMTVEELERGEKSPTNIHSGMSKYYFTLMDRAKRNDKGKCTTVSANVPIDDLDEIYDNTMALIPFMLNGLISNPNAGNTESHSTEEKSSAYTVPIAGKFQKQTAATILLNDPSQRAELQKQIAWLKENIGKYPKNQLQIDAIEEAINLFDNGQLSCNQSSIQSNGKIEIYKPPIKYFPGKRDNRGWNVCYRLQVSYNRASKMIELDIDNFTAPLENKGGKTIIRLGQADNRVNVKMDIPFSRWKSIVKKMDRNRNNFENMLFPEMWQQMISRAWEPSKNVS